MSNVLPPFPQNPPVLRKLKVTVEIDPNTEEVNVTGDLANKTAAINILIEGLKALNNHKEQPKVIESGEKTEIEVLQ